MSARLARSLWVVLLAGPPLPGAALAATEQPTVLRLIQGHSTVVESKSRVASAAIGNPRVARATAVSNSAILVNAVRPGSTSLTLILKAGGVVPYRIVVTHDLSQLAQYLRSLDPNIRMESDGNGDAVILTGTVASKAIVERAVEATYRFFGETDLTIRTNPRERREQTRGASPGAQPAAAAPAGPGSTASPASAQATSAAESSITGAGAEQSYIEEEITPGTTRVINLLTTVDAMLTTAQRLEAVLRRVDKAISVEEINGVLVLRGTVASPAVLSRALSVADRFVSNEGNPQFAVVSDRGGVLAGNLEPAQEYEPVVDPLFVPRIFPIGTVGAGGGTTNLTGGLPGSATTLAGSANLALPVNISPPKGNLGQNVSRADVVMVAGGKVMSLLEVREQPRVEIKMSVVSVDLNRTEQLGVYWRIDGSRVVVTTTGDRVFTPPNNPSTATIPPVAQGGANAIWKLVGGSTTVQVFLQALEQTGAAQSVSEPLLSAVSGESTSFLVGGNLPIPVQTVVPGTPTQNAFVANNVTFLEFGLRIVVRPTVLDDGRISIVLDQIFTEPDEAQSIIVNGSRVPGFKQRSVRTLTESWDGETWAVAGLVSDLDSKSTSAVPWISKLPILGVLFRGKSDQKKRGELIVTVTARRMPDTSKASAAATDAPKASAAATDGSRASAAGADASPPPATDAAAPLAGTSTPLSSGLGGKPPKATR
jgi:Flp pilus assembly secretin CpaC